MNIIIIKDENDYKEALTQINLIMQKEKNTDEEVQYLVIQSCIIELYEHKHYTF